MSRGPSWNHYVETILELFEDPPVVVDLREPVSSAVRGVVARRGFSGPFAVITAYNPHGRSVDRRQNRRRARRLLAAVERRGLRWVRADGISPDGRHREQGIAITMARSDAVDLAKLFGQSAIFWFDGSDFWLVGALVATEPIRLPHRAQPSAGR